MSKPNENSCSADIYENLPCQAMFNDAVLKIQQQQKLNKPDKMIHAPQSAISRKNNNSNKSVDKRLDVSSNIKECKNMYNDVKNKPKEMIYATPLRKSDRCKRNNFAVDTIIHAEHDCIAPLANEINEEMIDCMQNVNLINQNQNNHSLALSPASNTNINVDCIPSHQLKNHVILNFLKDTTQVHKKMGSTGKDYSKANFPNLAKEQYFTNLMQNKIQLHDWSQRNHNIRLNDNVGDDEVNETSSKKECNALNAITSQNVDYKPRKVYIQREWILKKIALYLEQRGKRQISGLSSANDVGRAGKGKLGNIETTASSFGVTRTKSSAYNGCLILGSNGSGKTSICKAIINGNSGTIGILNRKLLACYFVEPHNSNCENLCAFIRKIVLQILSHSSLLSEDVSQKIIDEGFEFLQEEAREHELKLDEVINNISVDKNTEDFLIDELKKNAKECEMFELDNCLENVSYNDISVLKRQRSTPTPHIPTLMEGEEIPTDKNYDTHPPKFRNYCTAKNDNKAAHTEKNLSDYNCDMNNKDDEVGTKSKLPLVSKSSPNKKSKIPIKLKKPLLAVATSEKLEKSEKFEKPAEPFTKNYAKDKNLYELNDKPIEDYSERNLLKNHQIEEKHVEVKGNPCLDYKGEVDGESVDKFNMGICQNKHDNESVRGNENESETEHNSSKHKNLDSEKLSHLEIKNIKFNNECKSTSPQPKKNNISPHPLPKMKCCRIKFADTYYELLLNKPEIFQYLSVENIKKNPDECFKKAILFPLLEITPPKSALLLLVDSIDENYMHESTLISTLRKRRNSLASQHQQLQQSRNVAELLSNHIHLFPKWLFLVCTSKKQMRPIAKIFTGFKKLTLDDLRKSHVVKDVQEYIIKRLNTDFKDSIMLTKEIIESLHQLYIKSNGCILYLEKVLNGIKENFFNFCEIKLIPCTLNGLYLYICQKSFNKKQFIKVRPILNVMLTSSGYLEKTFILNCLKTYNYTIDKDDFEIRLEMMRSIVCYDETGKYLKIFHSSFCDWLVDIKFATKKFICDINEGHAMICMYYLLVAESLCANAVRKFIFHLSKCNDYLVNMHINLDMPLLLLESRVNLNDCLYVNQLECCEQCKLEFVNDFNCLPKASIMVQKFLENEVSNELSRMLHEFFKPCLPTELHMFKILDDCGINSAKVKNDSEALRKSPEELISINMELENLLLSNEQLCSRLSPEASSLPSKESNFPNDTEESKCIEPLDELTNTNNFELIKGKAFIHFLANDGNHYLLERALNACKGLIDLEIEDCNGQTALNIAARNGHLEVVKLLLNYRNKLCTDTAGPLINNRIDINHADREGWTPLRSASWGGHTEVVKLLISRPECKIDLADKEGRTALRAAAWSGHEDILKMLIENGADVNSVDRQGRTSLIAASYMGHYDIVEILLKSGANVNHLDIDGRSALCVAALCCSSGYNKVISTLLEHGANTDQLDNDGMSPLLVSSFEGNADICELLLENNADPDLADFMGRTPLWAACTAGHSHVVKLLLFWGCSIDCMDSEGRTVLSIAVAQGNVETVGQLLDRGLDETHRDNAGWTPLHYAAFEGFHEVCVQLLEAGAKIDERDNEGKTALHLAAQEGRTHCVQVLLEILPTLLDQKTIDGKTAFRLACLEGHLDTVRYLIKYNCDVNAKDADSRTTLYVLSLENKLEMVKYLLEHVDIDVNASDSEGRTALHVAAWQGHTDMVQMLLTLGNANANAMDIEARTPLHSCAWQGNYDVMNILLSFGALPDHACKQGATALGISAQEGHKECVIILLKYGANPLKFDHCGRTPIKLAAKSNRTNILKIFESYHPINESTATVDEKSAHPMIARTPDQSISTPPQDNLNGIKDSPFSPHSSAFSMCSSLSNNLLSSSRLTAVNSTNSFNNFYQNTMQSDPRSIHKRKSVISDQSTNSINDLECKLISSQQPQQQYQHTIPLTNVNAETVIEISHNGRHHMPEAIQDINDRQIVSNDADFYATECMSPMYATPPHSPNSEISSPEQPKSILDINGCTAFSKNVPFGANKEKCKKSITKSTISDSHFARDTHMRIILGNLRGKHPTSSSSKNTRNSVSNNSAMRLLRNRFDSAAQLIRRTNNALSGSHQDSSSIGVKSSTFQWRKESQI